VLPIGVVGRPRVLVAGPDAPRFAQALRALPQLRPPTVAAGPAELTRIAADAVLLLTDHPADDVRTLTGRPGATDRILVVSHTGRPRDVLDAVQAGALGYLVHGEFGRADLVRAVFGALAGQSSLSRSATNALIEHLQCRRPAAGLGERQQEILRLAALGETNASIAGRLGLSEKTVRNQLSDIYTVLDVRNRTEAVRHWLGQ
jgi:DNA-binding NarL/FixJ family response regulator